MAHQLDREDRRHCALSGEELVRHSRAGLLKDRGQIAGLRRSRASSLRMKLCLPPPDRCIPANGEPTYYKAHALNGRFSIRLSTGFGRMATVTERTEAFIDIPFDSGRLRFGPLGFHFEAIQPLPVL